MFKLESKYACILLNSLEMHYRNIIYEHQWAFKSIGSSLQRLFGGDFNIWNIEFNSVQFIDHFYSPPVSKVHYGRALYSRVTVTLMKKIKVHTFRCGTL